MSTAFLDSAARTAVSHGGVANGGAVGWAALVLCSGIAERVSYLYGTLKHSMRQLLVLILSLGALVVFAQTPSDPPETVANKRIAAAQQTLRRTRELVEAGALARNRLPQAEENLADAQDEAILDRTLYLEPATEGAQQSVAEMLAAAQRRLDRQQERIEAARKLVTAGVEVPLSLAPFEAELITRQLAVDLAQSRAQVMSETATLAKLDQAIVESQNPGTGEERDIDANGMEHYEGDGAFDESRDLAPLAFAFAAQFEHSLPISAAGETDLHRTLGFDHRGRVDVALNPADPEGVWLRHYLKSRKIPYYAFAHSVPGRATAAHVHIGPGSTRLHSSD
jgi:hypothetical protein